MIESPKSTSLSPFSVRFREYRPILISQTILVAFVTLDYAFTTNLNHRLGSSFYILALITQLLVLLPLSKWYEYFQKRYLMLIAHFSVIGLFLIFFAPIAGAYYFLLFFYVTVSIYWYGWRGYVFGISASLVISIIGLMVQSMHTDEMMAYHVAAHFVVLFVSSLYVALLMLRKPSSSDIRFLRSTTSFEYNRLISLINSMPDAVITTDKKGIITLNNGAAQALINTNDELVDKPLSYVLKFFNEQDEQIDLLGGIGNSQKPLQRSDLYFISNENTKIALNVSISPIRSNLGDQNEGYTLVLSDISDRKNLDEERSEFIAVASHELRTPIAIAEANIATAMRPAVSAQFDATTKELLEQTHKNILFLADLINDLTTLDKADQDDLRIQISLLDPNAVVRGLAQNITADVEKAGLTLDVVTAEGSVSLLSSELYITQILQNLLSNAIKYTKNGTISLKVEAGKNNNIVFSVADTGVGIASSEKKHIFSKFYRSEDFRTRQTGGTGLGLYISQKLARRIHGRLWFESELNKGSTFYLSVPPIGALKKDQDQVTKEEIKDFASSV